jgi:predicted RNase H-like nuclease (RuvC/YqgF family)
MTEIDKLRQRLKNVDRNVIEYRMTVTEAHRLVQEFEQLEKELKEKPQVQVELNEPTITITQILDGGVF